MPRAQLVLTSRSGQWLRNAVAGLSADLAPRVGLHPGTARAALRKAVLAARNAGPPMIIKLAILLTVVLIVVASAAWAFLLARHLRIRLHPGKGFAHAFSLHLRWFRLAVLRRSRRIRPALPLRYRTATSVTSARSPGTPVAACPERSRTAHDR